MDTLASALLKAVEAHASVQYLKHQGSKVLFNGFWRNGDMQNNGICFKYGGLVSMSSSTRPEG